NHKENNVLKLFKLLCNTFKNVKRLKVKRKLINEEFQSNTSGISPEKREKFAKRASHVDLTFRTSLCGAISHITHGRVPQNTLLWKQVAYCLCCPPNYLRYAFIKTKTQ
uniref:Uncharacterized protein n=1 Tax=Sus scrofa TaxID=9823 RepID=A0A4X1VR65_PIG